MRAKCNHLPRIEMITSQKHKDGTSVMVCRECHRIGDRRRNRKKSGYYAYLEQQKGLCAFCAQPIHEEDKGHVDHNHDTGKKRGVVHAQCNQMIGGIENAIKLVGLARMLRYVIED